MRRKGIRVLRRSGEWEGMLGEDGRWIRKKKRWEGRKERGGESDK